MKYKGGKVGRIEQLDDLFHTGAHTGHFIFFGFFVQFVLHGSGGILSGGYFWLEAVFVIFGNHLSLNGGRFSHELRKFLRTVGGQGSSFVNDFHRAYNGSGDGGVHAQAKE